MTISLRIDKRMAESLSLAAKARGVSKSELIRQCLADYLDEASNRPTAWELGKELFGKVGSGRGDLARRRKQIFREKLNAKSDRR